MKVSGIYCIKNEINSKVYIGQTNNLKTRFKSHLSLLRKNKHANSHLQSAFNKYGESNFSFSILEVCENINERESYWIEKFDSVYKNNGYNKTYGGGNATRSQETKDKISKWQKGRKLSLNHCLNISKGNKGKKKHSNEAKERLRILYTGRTLTEETKNKISQSRIGKKLSPENRLKLKGRGSIPVVQYSLQMEFIREFESAKDAGDQLGFWKSDITQCCLGNRKTVKGFIFKYKNK